MSWKDKLDNGQYLITTGDGKSFSPLWKGAIKSREYNSTSFEFVDVDGTYVDRRKPKSAKYDLLIYFQGDDCLQEADDFEKSAEDPRYWVVEHPIYGTLKGQPTNLSRNDSDINIVEISIEFWESIINGSIVNSTTIKDEIVEMKSELTEDCANSFALKNNVTPADQNKSRNFMDKINSEYIKLLDTSGYNEYQQKLSEYRSSIDNIIVDSRGFINNFSRTIDSIINLPNVNVFQKIDSLTNLFNQLIGSFDLSRVNDFDRNFIESGGALIIATMGVVSLNPITGDYISRADVQKISSSIDSTYISYFLKLNDFEKQKNNKNINYSIDFKTQSKLNLLIKKTIFDLFSLSFNFKQERVVELLADSNLILLTHKYMGLDSEDENIETFRKINNITNNKLFVVKKGCKIKYFI